MSEEKIADESTNINQLGDEFVEKGETQENVVNQEKKKFSG